MTTIYIPFPCNPFSYAYMEQIAMQLYISITAEKIAWFFYRVCHYDWIFQSCIKSEFKWIYYHDVSDTVTPIVIHTRSVLNFMKGFIMSIADQPWDPHSYLVFYNVVAAWHQLKSILSSVVCLFSSSSHPIQLPVRQWKT